jgi:hypothetical protein
MAALRCRIDPALIPGHDAPSTCCERQAESSSLSGSAGKNNRMLASAVISASVVKSAKG